MAKGETVIATGRNRCPFAPHPRLIWKQADLSLSSTPFAELLNGADTIYHLSWSTIPADSNLAPAEDARINILGSLHLLGAIAAGSNTRFVFASSGGTVYGRLTQVPATEDHPLQPLCAYGVSKRAVEAYLDLFAAFGAISPVSLRMGNLFGPGQGTARLFGAISHFSKRALTGVPIHIFGDGGMVRDYVYIDDAVEALLAAGNARFSSPALNIGSGQGRSLNDIVAVLERTLGRPIAVERWPARPFDVPVSVLDPAKAQHELCWKPCISFEEGLARTLESMAKSPE